MISIEEFFEGRSFVQASAPGRVNLLGEHTDYNDGFVLPIATPMRTQVAVAPSTDGQFHFYAEQLDSEVMMAPDGHIHIGYGRYIEGCIRVLQQRGIEVPPMRVHVNSRVPMGAGLSSSAALEVAVLRALRQSLGLSISDVEIAQLAQAAEIAYAGVNCGIMDQMASSLCDASHMLLLDTRSLHSEVLALPPDTEVLVIDSGVARTLGATKYNERRAECAAAAAGLGVPSLRDVVSLEGLDTLPETYRRRARHVVSENARVQQAARGVSAEEFGALMNASHASLRNDYEVSIPALDVLSELMRTTPGVHGARLTGAGFGGACVALCEAGAGAGAGSAIVARYNAGGGSGQLLLPVPDSSCRRA